MTGKRALVFLLLIESALCLSAEVDFSGLDLSDKNILLFKGTTDAPGFGQYDTLFTADLNGTGKSSFSMKQLSFFPERILLAGNPSRLQIQNGFGLFRSDERFEKVEPVPGFPSFVGGKDIVSGRLTEVGTSSDGRYLAYLVSTSYAYGDLCLADMTTGRIIVVSKKLEQTVGAAPVSWSPDGKYFVYCRDRMLYYYSVAQLEENRVLDEAYRTLGKGSLGCVNWSEDGTLFHITGDLVWRIRTSEFFMQSLYAGFMKTGTVVGKIPFAFDQNFDTFRMSPDGRKILLNKNGQNLFLYSLSQTGETEASNLPYLLLPRNGTVHDILWFENIITVLVSTFSRGGSRISVYRLEDNGTRFSLQKDEGIRAAALSKDGSTIAVTAESGVMLKDYRTWKNGKSFAFREPLSVLWTSDGRLVLAGRYTIELLNTVTGVRKLVALSQAGEFGFSAGTLPVAVRLSSGIFGCNPETGALDTITAFEPMKAATASAGYRVYLDRQTSGNYQNIVMVREARSMGTKPLFVPPVRQYEKFPDSDEPSDFLNFTHGSRIRRREVAIVFDAVDSSEGLRGVLSTLSMYGIKATFFVNGEFIRRYPDAVKEIAETGHEVGSLFSTYFDMTNDRFKVDAGFVQKGLARNEDDYFAVTGRELSLIWHAPYYFSNSNLIKAASAMNYVYSGRDIDPLDWVSAMEKGVTGDLYYGSSELVERVMKLKRPGSIIPIRIGRIENGRDDYLFQKLDLLINSLLVAGYSVVPVTTLMDHAR